MLLISKIGCITIKLEKKKLFFLVQRIKKVYTFASF